MIVETFVAKRLYDKFTENRETFVDGQQPPKQGFTFMAFLGSIIMAILTIAYLIVVIRAVMVAFQCQGIAQAALALFMYPIYLVWNFTTLVQKGLCKAVKVAK